MQEHTTPTPKKVNNGSLTDEIIEEALKKTGGNQTRAAELLGYSRNYICERVNESEYLKLSCKQIVESRLDMAEDGLDSLILDKEFNAICFFLKTKGKHRGYVESRGDEGKIDIAAIQAFANMFSKIQVRSNDTGASQSEAN